MRGGSEVKVSTLPKPNRWVVTLGVCILHYTCTCTCTWAWNSTSCGLQTLTLRHGSCFSVLTFICATQNCKPAFLHCFPSSSGPRLCCWGIASGQTALSYPAHVDSPVLPDDRRSSPLQLPCRQQGHTGVVGSILGGILLEIVDL